MVYDGKKSLNKDRGHIAHNPLLVKLSQQSVPSTKHQFQRFLNFGASKDINNIIK